MDTFLEFLSSEQELFLWIGKFLLLYILSYLVVWFVAFILCRMKIFFPKKEITLKVYFAWLIPLILHAFFFIVFLIFSLLYFKQWELSPWYSLAYFLPVLISGVGIVTFILNIREWKEKS